MASLSLGFPICKMVGDAKGYFERKHTAWHTSGTQGNLTIRVHQPATPGTQAQHPQNLGHPGSGPQPYGGINDNTPCTDPRPASAVGPSGKHRLLWPPSLDRAWPVIENRMPWTHTAIHSDPLRTDLERVRGVGLPTVECPQGAPSFQPFMSTPKPSTHTLGTCDPWDPLFDASKHPKHLPHCPHYTDEKTEAQAPSKGQPQSWLSVMSRRCSEAQVAGAGRRGPTLSQSEKLNGN